MYLSPFRFPRQTRFHDRDCHELELIPQEGNPETRYYDIQSKLLAGSRIEITVEPFGEVPIETVIDDYRMVGNVLHPCSGQQVIAGSEDLRSRFQIEKIEANVEIPAERFQLPATVKRLATQPSSQPARLHSDG